MHYPWLILIILSSKDFAHIQESSHFMYVSKCACVKEPYTVWDPHTDMTISLYSKVMYSVHVTEDPENPSDKSILWGIYKNMKPGWLIDECRFV